MIVLSRRARDDLRQAHSFIAKDDPEAADRVVAGIVEVIGRLAAGHFEGREVVLRDGRIVRVWLASPYRIYYRWQGDVLQVVRVYHSARRPIER
ncbi:MAG: type II toxin-antitoxin system RelE/ParE family toxin [Deltaproteobacteria bacterium]|nr:type II toxin-antitoxin system RelE/ParE family toxin [Deltaproteobacteria bacterium]